MAALLNELSVHAHKTLLQHRLQEDGSPPKSWQVKSPDMVVVFCQLYPHLQWFMKTWLSHYFVCLSVRAISRGGGRRAWGKERRILKNSFLKLITGFHHAPKVPVSSISMCSIFFPWEKIFRPSYDMNKLILGMIFESNLYGGLEHWSSAGVRLVSSFSKIE